jgi:hypothetical protein
MQRPMRNLKIHILLGTDFFLLYNQEYSTKILCSKLRFKNE